MKNDECLVKVADANGEIIDLTIETLDNDSRCPEFDDGDGENHIYRLETDQGTIIETHEREYDPDLPHETSDDPSDQGGIKTNKITHKFEPKEGYHVVEDNLNEELNGDNILERAYGTIMGDELAIQIWKDHERKSGF